MGEAWDEVILSEEEHTFICHMSYQIDVELEMESVGQQLTGGD